jgi:hypothetical protein
MLTRQGNASADTVRQAVGLRCRYLDSCESEKPSGCGRHTAYGLVRAYTGGRSTTGDGGGDNASMVVVIYAPIRQSIYRDSRVGTCR